MSLRCNVLIKIILPSQFLHLNCVVVGASSDGIGIYPPSQYKWRYRITEDQTTHNFYFTEQIISSSSFSTPNTQPNTNKTKKLVLLLLCRYWVHCIVIMPGIHKCTEKEYPFVLWEWWVHVCLVNQSITYYYIYRLSPGNITLLYAPMLSQKKQSWYCEEICTIT